ncbi:hypothetical protein [Rhodococcus sp. NPDC049939]|uniref:hypothetical protein n=1 Tax=Rhodococcus sp. NPDC049939 TaxID=3155511 RepID=UPI0033C3CA4A
MICRLDLLHSGSIRPVAGDPFFLPLGRDTFFHCIDEIRDSSILRELLIVAIWIRPDHAPFDVPPIGVVSF